MRLFQRSPQYVMPKKIFPGTSDWDQWLQKRAWLRPLARLKVYFAFEKFILRRQLNPDARLKGEAAFRALLEKKVKDPELRRKLTPNYPMGCKRQLVSDVWVRGTHAAERRNRRYGDRTDRRRGLVTRDGKHHKVDTIIYGTGFTPTSFLTPMKVHGLKGRDLNEAWRDGAEAYLGITVSGFPNFFMMYGPNTNAPSSIIFMLECRGALYRELHQDAAKKTREVHERARRHATGVQQGSAGAPRRDSAGAGRLRLPTSRSRTARSRPTGRVMPRNICGAPRR